MIQNFSDLDIVARTLYGEARGEVARVGIIGLEAVASVIWNRWKANPTYFGNTPRDVCLKPYQLSCWNKNDPNLQRLLEPNIDDGTYALCCRVAETYLSGSGDDVVNGADHYHAIWIDTPSWACGKTPVIEIGIHRFYRLSV